MTIKRTGRIGVLLAAILVIACSGDDGASVATPSGMSATGSDGQTPVIRSISLIPNPPESGGVIRAVVTASDPDGPAPNLTFVWTVRGRVVGSDASSIELPSLRKGDRIAVRVVASDGSHASEPRTAEVEVANSRPRILDLRVRRERRQDIEHWVVEPMTEDPDGDRLEFEYSWRINGRDTEDRDDAFAVDTLRRGDRLTVRVVASDGLDRSDPVESAAVEIANSAPEITSRPRGLDANGEFHYAITAEDADGDRGLRYELVDGPEGLTLDESTGRVDWAPTIQQAGEHRIEIAVEDRKGGRSLQVFVVPVVVREIDEGAAPASPSR